MGASRLRVKSPSTWSSHLSLGLPTGPDEHGSHSNFLLSSSNHNPFHALVVLFYIHRNYSLEPSQQYTFFQDEVASHTPNPLLWRTGMSLLVWIITFDLSSKRDPTSSYATASIALRIIWPLKLSHYFKVETPSVGLWGSLSNLFLTHTHTHLFQTTHFSFV